MTLYLRTTMDEYELPVAVATNARELSRMTGTDYHTIMSSISHGYKGWYRIQVEDDEVVDGKRGKQTACK